jgi:hypothetical protein
MWAIRPAARWRLAALALLAGLAFAPAAAVAQTDDGRARLEGAFLVNFVRFTQWPPDRFAGADAPYVVTVVGSSSVVRAIREVADAAGTVHGRAIQIRRSAGVHSRGQRELLEGSHMVFVHRSSGASARDLVEALRGAPVLTVGDSEGFLDAGGMLGLVSAGPRMTFVANAAAMQDAGLVVSAKVLKLAEETRR